MSNKKNGSKLFTQDELVLIGQVLGQLQFRPGQSNQMAMTEAIILKIKDEIGEVAEE